MLYTPHWYKNSKKFHNHWHMKSQIGAFMEVGQGGFDLGISSGKMKSAKFEFKF
jgi:hypothetical protein